MKKWILSILAVAGSISVQAQGVGIEAGANMNMLRYNIAGSEIHTGFRPGFRAGVMAEEAIGSQLAFQYGVYFTTKGTNLTMNRKFMDGDILIEQQTRGFIRTNNLEIPLSLLYYTNLENGGRFFAGGGPYLGIALGGFVSFDRDIVATNNGSSSTTSLSSSYPIGVGSEDFDDIKRIDAGLQVQAGYELRNGLFTRAHVSYGLMDVDPTPDKAYNVGFGLTIGYMIR